MTKLIEKGIAFGVCLLMLATPVNATPTVEKEVIKPSVNITDQNRRQIECLARSIYHEAGNQSRKGKIAVANVVMNRTNDRRFPSSPCNVIHQRYKNSCQFSWVCTGARVRNQNLYSESLRIAELVYTNSVDDVTMGAKYFHNTSVRPGWSRRFTKTIRIDSHIFYRG